MVIQAEAGPIAVVHRPDQAIQTFESIGAAGKRAMAEMRQLLGVLKEGGTSPREPQPGLAQVDDLVAQTRLAGLVIDLSWRGHWREIPTAVDLSAYRVVQEALTNCLRHAPGSNVDVVIDFGKDLTLEVSDDGSTTPRVAVAERHTGNGLTAMRERVSLLGGQLTVGPHDAGWRVLVTLPLADKGSR
jgi:signal transduction histidine kinase